MSDVGLIDVHAHLCDPAFDADRSEVLQRAKDAGIAFVIAVSETFSDAQKNLKLAEKHPEILPAAGLYPTVLDLEQADRVIDFIHTYRDKICAIGEVGLDHWKVKEAADLELQREIFLRFIKLSLELDIPLSVHSRSAGRQVIEMLLRSGARKVILHAFDGKASTVLPAVEAGYFFSLPPSIVRSRQKQKLVKSLPLESILLETDSPVLGPDPEQRNEPANLVIALRAVAEIKGVDEKTLRQIVVENTRRLFAAR